MSYILVSKKINHYGRRIANNLMEKKVTKTQLIFLYENDICHEWRAVIREYASKFTILDDDDSFVEIEQKHLDLISECSKNQLNLLRRCNITEKDNLAISNDLTSISKLEEHLKGVNKILFPDDDERGRIQLLKGAGGRSDNSDRYRALYLKGKWEIIDKISYTIAIPLKK